MGAPLLEVPLIEGFADFRDMSMTRSFDSKTLFCLVTSVRESTKESAKVRAATNIYPRAMCERQSDQRIGVTKRSQRSDK